MSSSSPARTPCSDNISSVAFHRDTLEIVTLEMVIACTLASLAACGRIGFSPNRDDASGGDAITPSDSPPDTIGATCSDQSECGRCQRCASVCIPEPVTDIFLGHRTMCYLGANGDRWCAGENSSAELGLGFTSPNVAVPTRAEDGGGWQRLFMFYAYTIAIRNDKMFHWGAGDALPVDDGASGATLRMQFGTLAPGCRWNFDGSTNCDPSGELYPSFASADLHQCGVRGNRSLWCWGTSQWKALGQDVPDGTTVANPVQVGTDLDWDEVTVFSNSDMLAATCARKTNGTLWCWGAPQLTGTNGTDVGATPTQITSFTDWERVEGHYSRGCASRAGGLLYCWGFDAQGPIAPPDISIVMTPTQIGGPFDRWVVGGHHVCGQATGQWSCYGWNAAGQLGIGTTQPVTTFSALCP